ncbi:MAG TPA: hypothetical protein VI455_02635 [Terriglobia bacterium]
MLPREIKAADFRHYPPQARQLAIDHLALLQALPAVFVPILLREIQTYDWKFPAERRDLERQLAYLGSLSAGERQQVMAGFARVRLSSQLEDLNWVEAPADYSAQLSAYLWASHQMDGFRDTAEDFTKRLAATAPREPLPTPRLGIVVLGQGVTENTYPLFRKLRPHGVYFTHIRPQDGLRTLLDAVDERSKAHPVSYGHWHIDGGPKESLSGEGVTCVSYESLAAVRSALLKRMDNAIRSGIGGPEAMRTMLSRMRPEELGLSDSTQEAVLNRFQVSVLTDGSGTQFFSTTFVQWTAREALRRAQPLTLMARFTPRQRQRPMNELIGDPQRKSVPDPEGSLIDADMGAYLTWLNQQRLPGAEKSSFLVWFEDHHEALAIGPAQPRGTASNSTLDLRELLSQVS